MKKLLLSILATLPFLVNAQVSSPEKVYTAQPNTGYTATATSEKGDGATPASYTVDGDNATYWETVWSPSQVPLPHTLTITLPTAQTIAGVYIVDRPNLGNSPKVCTIETSINNGADWVQQGGTFTLPYYSDGTKIYLAFPADVTSVTNYRIIVTENQANANQVTNIAETGVITASIADNTAWDRTGWIVTGDNTHGNGGTGDGAGYGAMVDNNNGTYWHTRWGAGDTGAEGTIGPFPGDATTNTGSVTLNFDMLSDKQINQISFVSRSGYTGRNPRIFTVAYSTNGTDYTTLGPFTNTNNTTANPTPVKIALGTTIIARYLRINITKVNKNSGSADANTSIAEFRAHFDQTLPVNLTSFTAKAKGSSVNLNWATASEKDASHFNITRSKDGSNFTTIGKVDAAGNSNTAKNYSFTDNAPYVGVNYYQLQQVDYNGDINTSGITSAKVALSSAELIVKETSADQIVIALKGVNATSGTITAVNAQGQKIASQAADLANGNTITVKTAAKGLIILTLTTAEGSISKKIIK